MTIGRDALYDALIKAYLAARKNERNTPAQLQFELNLESNIWDLREELLNRTYKPSPLICFIIEEPVKREVFAPSFRDRVVSHFIFNQIAPIFERTFIYDSYSCRKYKGTLFGIERAEHHIRSVTNNYKTIAYGLTIDISGYFMNINRALLLSIVKNELEKFRYRTINGRVLNDTIDFSLIYYLLEVILTRQPLENCKIIGSRSRWKNLPKEKSLFCTPDGIGLIIGDLMSQLFSNIYLNVLDQYIKRVLKIKHYGRYVDDAFILHTDKGYICSLIPIISQFLSKELGLKLNMKKTRVFKLTQNFKFLGACIKPHRRYPSNRTIKSFKKKIKSIEIDIYKGHVSKEDIKRYRSTINSYCGYLKKFKCWKIMNKTFEREMIREYFHFLPNYRKAVVFKDKSTSNV